MKLLNYINDFFDNCGVDKLFLSVIPAFLAAVLACNVFTYNLKLCIFSLIAVILVQIVIKFFDDFVDWSKKLPLERQEIEEKGIRGRYDKAIYYLGENGINPKNYFYISLFLLALSIGILIFISFSCRNVLILIPIIVILFLGFINYSQKLKHIIAKIGSETITAAICAPITMFFVFFASSKCLTTLIIYASLIMFFFVLNICFTASILNQKIDIMTNKTTLPVIINNQNMLIFIIIFLNLIPYLLTAAAIILNILPKTSYFTLLLIPHSIWLTYLCIQYIRNPQILYKWHFLMGFSKYSVQDEQNGISWYTTRYNLARNIFFAYTIILIFTVIRTF